MRVGVYVVLTTMGGSVSQVFRSGSALLTNRDGKVSEYTIEKVKTVFEILRANPKISIQTLEGLLTRIAKVKYHLALLFSFNFFSFKLSKIIIFRLLSVHLGNYYGKKKINHFSPSLSFCLLHFMLV